MRRISAFFISMLLIITAGSLRAQDSILIPLKLNAGIDLSGPVIYMTDKNNLNAEGFFSADRNERISYVFEGGYSRFRYSQYNYDYLAKGIFIRAGADFNMLEPQTSKGKYRAGIGLRYGASIYSMETPSFSKDNYWGSVTSSIPQSTRVGHFLEVTPGVKTELFKNISIGWSVRLRLLISAGTGRELRPVHMPGFGNAGKSATAGFSYFLVWQVPYKSKMVVIKKEEPEEVEEDL